MKRQHRALVIWGGVLMFFPAVVFAGSATVSWQPNTEPDLKEYRVYYGQSSRRYGAPIPVGKATSYTVTGLTEGKTYYFAVTAVDTSGNESGYSAEATKTIPDVSPPSIEILSPTTAASYPTDKATVDLSGKASDNLGVTLVTWINSQGGNGTATGTTNWSISKIPLSAGDNVITVKAKAAAGNEAQKSLKVVYTPPDTEAPTVDITSPTTDPSYTTDTKTISLAGTASDNLGVTQVTWSNSQGGSGTAVGTLTWSISDIPLVEGLNVLTVAAIDKTGNKGTKTLKVTYIAPDTIAPAPPKGIQVK